jgi:phosphatidylinositol glycan class A protein
LLLNVNIKNIKTIITVSQYYKSLVIEVLGGNIPVVVVPNGIDTNIFKFESKVNSPLKICTLGLLIPRKRVFDLIVNNPELKINIGGKGSEKITLEKIIKKFKIKAKLHGFVKLPSFYYDHDIFLMNSSDESFGVSMIEAMSCGLIPLCFSWGGIEEILPQENIYKNYAELNDKLKLLNNHSDDELLKIKHKMRKLVEEKYTLKIQVNKFIKLFSE